ncbi:23S rRNA (adenine(2503)-C(2))-methyltransferase RlmN [candidate division KSB1 bacterium]|nr:23S rRNA (adenine(2503)-C(2))-methyltransferase RlmN [candidate division KSB1 bacterium]
MERINVIGMNLEELRRLMQSLGEADYRADQLFNWIYKKRIETFYQMSNFSLLLRRKITSLADIGRLQLARLTSSPSKTTQKFLFELDDGHFIESVYMKDRERITLCISSQVGCPLNCAFCATGKMGFVRNLSVGELVEQVIFIQRYLNIDATNIVFMGMGEPFLNYDNVLDACDIISHENGIAIGKRKITISTAGVVPRIKQFIEENRKYKLAISLNAADNETRSRLMPINERYPLPQLMQVARDYQSRTKARLTFEYVLIKGVNDRIADARKLKDLLTGFQCKLNIIPYNSIDNEFSAPVEQSINAFIQPFLAMNIVISVRRSKGSDIQAACGQLYAATLKP